MTIPGADTLIPIGVYRTALPNITAVQAYEAFLQMPPGTTVDYVLSYLADTPANWGQFEQAMLAASTNGGPGTVPATAWVPLLGGRQLVLSVPACCMGTTWANEASGANDAHWTALANTLVNGGLGNCVLRIAREFNGSWYRWQVTSSNYTSYQAAYAHIVTIMRNAGFTGQFMWNPYLLQGNFAGFSPPQGVELVYPYSNGATGSDTIVDLIGLDLYDGPDAVNYPWWETIRTTAQQQAVWRTYLNPVTGWDELSGWRSLAASHHKPGLAYPEWGLRLWNDGNKYEGGGDNPLFVNEMAAWMKDTSASLHAFWEDTGMGVSDPDNLGSRKIAVPNARAAFLNQFGY